MQREASELPGKLRIFHVQLRLITVVSRLVPFPAEYSACFVALSYGSLRSDGVDPVPLRLSRYVTIITARDV